MNFLARIRLGELAVVLILMFFGVAGAIPGIAPNEANEMTGSAASSLQAVVGIGVQFLFDGLILMWLLRNRQVWADLFRRERFQIIFWPMALAGWAVASTFWSGDMLLTARRAIPFALAGLFGVFLAARVRDQRFLALLQIAFLALAVWSAVLALGFPAIGLEASSGHGGDWQGVFTQKNACGRAMVFALAALFCSGRMTAGRLGLLFLFSVELWLSGSRGAWMLGGAVVAAVLLFHVACRFDRPSRVAILGSMILGGVALGLLTTVDFGQLAPLLGRDATLTGRTEIWHQVWLAILHRPLLGYGFSAFWRGSQPPSWQVVVALRFILFHAHNGFLEIWLELGVVGLLLFAAGFARAAWLLWPELRAGRFEEAAWPFAVLLLTLLYDLDENTLLSFNGLFWILYVGALTRIELLAADRREVARLLERVPRARIAAVAPLAPLQPLIPSALLHAERPQHSMGSPWL